MAVEWLRRAPCGRVKAEVERSARPSIVRGHEGSGVKGGCIADAPLEVHRLNALRALYTWCHAPHGGMEGRTCELKRIVTQRD